MQKSILIFSCLFLSFICFLPIFAGTTGKIAGTVIDQENGEPIAGANIIIEGTAMGAATDLDGDYTILQVPPDIYTVSVSVIGYGKIKKSDIRVYIDQTTRINFSLKTEVIEGEVITVIADLPTVKRDVSTSVAAMSSEEVYALPISNVQDALGIQAGITGDLEIRGGGKDRSLYMIDGIVLRDPKNNNPITGIALSAVQEISVERGGFNAEYGQVRSGIVNVVTKEGDKASYQGSVTVQYNPPHKKYFGISPYDRNSMWFRPYLDDAVCWTGTDNGTWNEYEQRQYPDFKGGWNELSRGLLMDDDPDNDLSPAAAQKLFMWETRRKPVTDQGDYIIDAGFGGPVPFIGGSLGNLRFFASYRKYREMLLIPLTRDDYVEEDMMLKLIADISPAMKLNISVIKGNNKTLSQNWAEATYVRYPNDVAGQIFDNDFGLGKIFGNAYYALTDINHNAYNAKFTHTLSNKTFYEVSLEYLRRKYDTKPPAARDTAKVYEIVPGYFVDEAPYGYSYLIQNGIIGMIFGGHTCKQRESTTVSATTLKFDYTSQVNFNNLVKLGAEFVYNDLDMDYGQMASFTEDEYTYRIQMKLNPVRGAVYLQDKLETKEFVANLGIRLDYSASRTDWYNGDPYSKEFFSNDYDPTIVYATKKSKSQWQISPRLGISHPITEKSKLFFNYGHFKQMPSYSRLFRISRTTAGEMDTFGDPDLTLAKTISYELGYDHEVFDVYLIQLAAFYQDISDQPDTVTYIDTRGGIEYDQVNSNSYEDIRGFEVTLKKTSGEWWNAFVNYTYQVNTRGQYGSDKIYKSNFEQTRYEDDSRNFYQHKPVPRPYARGYLSVYTPIDFGPQALGMHPLAEIMLNVLTDWRSGDWRTWNPKNIKGITLNVHEKDYFNLKLRLSKTFAFKKVDVEFFMDVDNVLNIKRLQLNAWCKGDDYNKYMESLHLPESEAYDNIKGNDRVGEYRKVGVTYQPIEVRGIITTLPADQANPDVIYYGRYETDTDPLKYWYSANGEWREVEKSRMNKVLDDRAYIDMPNNTSFQFLNPRSYFFGIRTSFKLN